MIRDMRDLGFAQVESALLRDPTITPQCKALYGLLITYGPDRIFPGHNKLAECMGVKRRSIIRWLAELRKHGLIDWERRGSTSNNYFILGYKNALEVRANAIVTQESQQMCQESHNRCDTGITRSRSSYPDPDINMEGPADAGTPTPQSENRIVDKEPEPPKVTAKHPAIQAFREVTHRYPAKAWYTVIAEIIGGQERDVDRWKRIVMAWVGVGWNPCNVKGMLDYWGKAHFPGENGGNGSTRELPEKDKEAAQPSVVSMDKTPEWLK
jgi:hypothetical protein